MLNKLKNFLIYISDKLLLFIFTMIVMLPLHPHFMHHTLRDSGLFMYIGWRILEGEIPYKDVWDHKPPIIFYLNSLGLLINEYWGIWLIQVIFIFTSFLLLHNILSKIFDNYVSIVGIFISSISLFFAVEGGNLTTEYTILFQVLAIYLFYKYINNQNNKILFLIGVLGGLAFFTKQTSIGIWIAIGIYFLAEFFSKKNKKAVKEFIIRILTIGLGVFLNFMFWHLFFLSQNSLNEYYDANFHFNFVYSSIETQELTRSYPLLVGLLRMQDTGILILSLIGSLYILFSRNKFKQPILLLTLINLPIELILISISDRAFYHYYMVLIPSFTILTEKTISVTFKNILSQIDQNKNTAKFFISISIIAIIFWLNIQNYISYINELHKINIKATLVDEIVRITNKDDDILIWGAESSILFFAKRTSIDKYVYQYPLNTPGYTTEEMVINFLDNIIDRKPKYIINAINHKAPMFVFSVQSNKINEKIEIIRNMYELERYLYPYNWELYSLKIN